MCDARELVEWLSRQITPLGLALLRLVAAACGLNFLPFPIIRPSGRGASSYETIVHY